MTALCGGGTSSAAPGFGLSVSVGTSVIAGALNNVPTPLAIALAGVLGVMNFELNTYCTTDPPAMPVFTAQDYVDALNTFDTVANIAAINKFRDALGNLFWPTFCKCDSVATPAPPSLPAPPSNLPVVNPPQLTPAPPTTPTSARRTEPRTATTCGTVAFTRCPSWRRGRDLQQVRSFRHVRASSFYDTIKPPRSSVNPG